MNKFKNLVFVGLVALLGIITFFVEADSYDLAYKRLTELSTLAYTAVGATDKILMYDASADSPVMVLANTLIDRPKLSGTAAADDTTPSMSGIQILTIPANSQATAITDLDDVIVGAIYTLIGASATYSSTIADSGNFALTGAMTLGLDDNITLFVQEDNDYIELSRSDN